MGIPIDDKRKYLQKRLEFVNLSKEVSAIISEFDIKLNYLGFTETFQDYINCESSDVHILYDLVKDLNFWINYMGDIQSVIKYYTNYFLIISDAENDIEKANKAKHKHFVLKNYNKILGTYKTRFRNARKDCIEKIKDSKNAFYREM